MGINWLFLTVDFSGALFSMLSLVPEEEFDMLAGVMYAVCMTLEIGIFGCHFVWLVRQWWGGLGGREKSVEAESIGGGGLEGLYDDVEQGISTEKGMKEVGLKRGM